MPLWSCADCAAPNGSVLLLAACGCLVAAWLGHTCHLQVHNLTSQSALPLSTDMPAKVAGTENVDATQIGGVVPRQLARCH